MSLNFKEKRALQKTVAETQAALRGGKLGFKEKREAQKALRDAMTKLGAATTAPAPAGGRPDVSGMKARFTSETVMDVPGDWIVMNAPRPLLGTKTLEGGPFLSGRFYAAIDPADSAAAAFVVENKKLDARVVFQGIPPELQVEMALVGNKYAETYRSDFQGDELFDVLVPQINNLQDKTVAELESIIVKARGGQSAAVEPDAGGQPDAGGENDGTPDPAPEGDPEAAESPFQPLLAGDLNNLAIPDFIKRLEAAYEEEESLDKAKQAAIGYLEANRAKLEAA